MSDQDFRERVLSALDRIEEKMNSSTRNLSGSTKNSIRGLNLWKLEWDF